MCQHLALFYADAYPAAEVGDFFAAGLAAGDSCLALLTAPHRRAVEEALQARGVRIEAAAYVAVDTDAALAQWRVDGRLDLRRASEAMTPLMTPPAGGSKRRIRAAGDLAPTLVAAGQAEDAVAFEALVHRLTVEHGASVICAYAIHDVCGHGNMNSLLRLSAEHATLEFPERLWLQGLQRPVLRLAAAG
jgi:MEDS: MEthanogen/methylotroph, DcmR Sensory domain